MWLNFYLIFNQKQQMALSARTNIQWHISSCFSHSYCPWPLTSYAMDWILTQLHLNQFMSVKFSDSIMFSNTISPCVSVWQNQYLITGQLWVWTMCVFVYLGQGLVVGNINPSSGFLLFSAQRNDFTHTHFSEFLEIWRHMLLRCAKHRVCECAYSRVWDDPHNSIMSYSCMYVYESPAHQHRAKDVHV